MNTYIRCNTGMPCFHFDIYKCVEDTIWIKNYIFITKSHVCVHMCYFDELSAKVSNYTLLFIWSLTFFSLQNAEWHQASQGTKEKVCCCFNLNWRFSEVNIFRFVLFFVFYFVYVCVCWGGGGGGGGGVAVLNFEFLWKQQEQVHLEFVQ